MDDDREYVVVMNDEEQYSIWFTDREIPPGWHDQGVRGTKKHCLDHIEEVWTDIRPKSLRDWLAEQEENGPRKTSDEKSGE